MKLLLLGANGQVGWQLRRSLAPLGQVIALHAASETYCGDLRRPAELVETVKAIRPDVVVNAAAFTAVDRAEEEPDAAFAVNALASEVLAQATSSLGIWLVHYSTDYVYAGDGERPWGEADPTGPLSVYGKSKLAGDLAIARHNPKHLILRTSWVYDSWGQNFVKSILKAATVRDRLDVVADQWGAPTRAALIADVTALALRSITTSSSKDGFAGVYHLAAAGHTNWRDYAALVVELGLAHEMPLRVSADKVAPIPAAQYRARAPRPANSRLDTSKLERTFGFSLPPWQDGVGAVVAEIANNSKFLQK